MQRMPRGLRSRGQKMGPGRHRHGNNGRGPELGTGALVLGVAAQEALVPEMRMRESQSAVRAAAQTLGWRESSGAQQARGWQGNGCSGMRRARPSSQAALQRQAWRARRLERGMRRWGPATRKLHMRRCQRRQACCVGRHSLPQPARILSSASQTTYLRTRRAAGSSARARTRSPHHPEPAMRVHVFTHAGLLFLCAPALATAGPSRFDQCCASSLQQPDTRPSWRKLSDRVLTALWGPPNTASSHGAAALDANVRGGRVSPPGKLLARYGDDMVLRFNVSTEYEARKLGEAANTLFLDLWEYSENWVDIRIAKDVVSAATLLLGKHGF